MFLYKDKRKCTPIQILNKTIMCLQDTMLLGQQIITHDACLTPSRVLMKRYFKQTEITKQWVATDYTILPAGNIHI